MQPDQMINSAKGWHSIQLAVMGFLGLCGVLRVGEEPAGPEWLAMWSTGMAILSFVASLLSMWMVGGVAFPTYSGEEMPASAPGRLKAGIGMTFVAVIMAVLGAADGWWPASQEAAGGATAGQMEVRDSSGNVACGKVAEGARPGAMWLETDKGRVTVTISTIATMRPVSSCS